MEGTLEGHINQPSPYPSGDIPVEYVGIMTVSWSAAQGNVCTGVQLKPVQVELLDTQPSLGATQSSSPSQTHQRFNCQLCRHGMTCQGTAASVAARQREVEPGKGNSLLKIDKVAGTVTVIFTPASAELECVRSNAHKDHTPVFNEQTGEPSARYPATPMIPAAAESSNPSEQS